jgi:hypothetical protein
MSDGYKRPYLLFCVVLTKVMQGRGAKAFTLPNGSNLRGLE